MEKNPEITITDIPCPECGKTGATGENGEGLCLECGSKKLEKIINTKLGEKTLAGILEQIKELLTVHAEMLNVAYIKHGEEKFSVSFKTVIEVKGGSNRAETTISYRPEPDMKDSTDGYYDENQMGLFEDNK